MADWKIAPWKTVGFSSILLLLPLAGAAAPQDGRKVVARGAESYGPVTPIRTVAVRDLPTAPTWQPGDPIQERPRRFESPSGDEPLSERKPHEGWPDPLPDRQMNREPGHAPTITVKASFEGLGFSGGTPPDTVGDVGPSHYVQAVNATRIAIFDKTGTLVAGPFDMDWLAPSAPCTDGAGDPMVLYDGLADRWFLQELTASGTLCIYVSTSGDPVGSYNLYSFTPPNFPDYPHYGVWPDAYYATTNEGSGFQTAYAFDRASMLAGLPATLQRLTVPPLSGYGFQTLTPADHDGAAPPPPSSPGIFMRHNDDEAHSGSPVPANDFLELWEMDVDFNTPANTTLAALPRVAIADFNSWMIDYSTIFSTSQPGSGVLLDAIREAILHRLVYRNFGSHETLLGVFATNRDPATKGNNVEQGHRWFELRRTDGGSWSLQDEGTYGGNTNSPTANFFVGSVAMDGQGNIALGYNKTDVGGTAVFPSIGFTGRLADDPAGTMGPENHAVLGRGPSHSGLWSSRAAMSIDPVDDCTFWLTHQYIPVSGSWGTRVTSFAFEECLSGFNLSLTPAQLDVCAPTDPDPVFQVDVTATDGWTFPVDLTASGEPPDVTSTFVPNGQVPDFTSTYTLLGTGGSTTGSYAIEVTGVGGDPTSTVRSTQALLNLAVNPPGPIILTSPADGAVGVAITPTLAWTASPDAMTYDLEIASDPAFANVVYGVTDLTSLGHDLSSALEPSTTYFWRVTAKNVCGSITSETFSFTTALLICETFVSTDVPKPIPEGGGTEGVTTSTLTVDTTIGTIADVNVVDLIGTHTYMGDLDFNIDSPAATSVRLLDPACDTAEDFDINFDDEAAPGAPPCPPTDGGTYQPANPLSAFAGESSAGTWTLTINDNLTADTGELDNWGLEICVAEACDGVAVASEHLGGEADDFAPLPEDAHPSFELIQHFRDLGLEPTLSFDELPSGEGAFAHTLDGIPPTPISALLTLRIRAGANADAGDLLSLQLTGSSFLWQRPLSMLPEANGQWLPGQVTTFQLNLGQLPSDPGEVNILSSLADGQLDIAVHSHDAVDFVQLDVVHCSTTLELAVVYDDVADPDVVESDLIALGAVITERADYFQRFGIEIDRKLASQVSQLPDVVYVEEILQPFVLMDLARSLIRANVIQGPPPNYLLSGQGVKLGLIDNAGLDHPCDLPATRVVFNPFSPARAHATRVAGVMAGDGDPGDGYFSRGMAPEATVYSWLWGGVTSKMLSAVDDHGVWAINNSYTHGYNHAPYGNIPRELDRLVFDKHLNIFWAMGNRNQGFNLLVNEAGAKNTMTIGGIGDTLNHYGSLGPTQDGRVKPDVVAKAVCLDQAADLGSWCPYSKLWAGTSFASPAATGVAGLLAERFRARNSGRNPRPALVRAILNNSATDLGNPGPDYTFGFGLLDAVSAIEVVDRVDYLMSSVANGDTHTWFFEATGGCSELRFMTAWSDPPAAPLANPTLVNDLDLRLISPFANVQLPLTLDPANPAALAQPALNRRDNVEQVIVASPQSGLWRVEVEGFDVPQGPQEYALTWVGEGPGCQVRALTDCVQPPPGMAAWWPLDEPSGPTAGDLAGNHSAGHEGTPVFQASGKVGGALFVDASNYLSVPSSAQLDVEPSADWSLDLWLRASATRGFLSKIDPADGTGFEVFIDSGNELGLVLVSALSTHLFSFPGCQVNLNQWHHVAITVDWSEPNGVVCYVDGVAYPSPADPTGVDSTVSNSAPMLMGRGTIFPNLGGFMLDEVEVFRRVLSADEVAGLFAADFNGKCRDICHVDWDRGFCPGDTQVTATLRLWNFDLASHSYAYSGGQLPGRGGTLGQGCNVDGPTTFTYPGANPVTVPPGGSPATQIQMVIDRPADLNMPKVVGCYEVLVTNLDTGYAQSCRGSVQDTRFLCPITPGPTGISLRVGQSISSSFTVQNASGSAQIFDFEIVESMMNTEAGGQAVFSIEGLPPGTPFVGTLSLAAGEIGDINFEVTATAYDTFDVRDFLLVLHFEDGSTQVLESITAEALPPERDGPPFAALELIKDGELDAGEDGVVNPGDLIHYTLKVTNVGNLDVTNVLVGDPLLPSISCPSGHPIPVLVPGAMEICTGVYAITQADIEAGIKHNTATVTGIDPNDQVITAEDSHSETISNGSIFTDGFESGDTSAWSSTVP